MNPWEEPTPQTYGQLVPPSRRPPTAVGLAMLPEPFRPIRFQRSWRSHVLVKATGLMSVGSAVAWFAPWSALRIAGLVFAGLGFAGGTTWLVRRHMIRAVRVWNRWQTRRHSS